MIKNNLLDLSTKDLITIFNFISRVLYKCDGADIKLDSLKVKKSVLEDYYPILQDKTANILVSYMKQLENHDYIIINIVEDVPGLNDFVYIEKNVLNDQTKYIHIFIPIEKFDENKNDLFIFIKKIFLDTMFNFAGSNIQELSSLSSLLANIIVKNDNEYNDIIQQLKDCKCLIYNGYYYILDNDNSLNNFRYFIKEWIYPKNNINRYTVYL